MGTAVCSCINAGVVAASPARSTATAGFAATNLCAARSGPSGGACGCWPRWCHWWRLCRVEFGGPKRIRSNKSQPHLPPTFRGRAGGEGRDNRQRSGTVQALTAFDTEAVPAEVVMSARGAHQPARWVGLQPALALAPIPDPILRAEHPPSALAVEDRKVTYGKPERPGLEPAVAALFDEHSIASLGIRKGVDRHAKSMSGLPTPRQRSGRGGCRIP